MKILNAYCGIGGNRKLWGDEHQVTAVEYDKNIAEIYTDYFPDDTMIITDAHEYLLEHFNEFDFIWSSPPCPTHSQVGKMGMVNGQHTIKYPDMSLYQEIILLQEFTKNKIGFCVENVKPYYKPLLPAQGRERHLFWANFYIREFNKSTSKHHKTIKEQQEILGYDLSKYKVDKRKVLRNCVIPDVGKHILGCFINQQTILL